MEDSLIFYYLVKALILLISKFWKHLWYTYLPLGNVKEKHSRTRVVLFLLNIRWTFVFKQYIHIVDQSEKGPWNLRKADRDLLVHRKLANSGVLGMCSETVFALSTSIHSVFTIKIFYNLPLISVYCDLKIFPFC